MPITFKQKFATPTDEHLAILNQCLANIQANNGTLSSTAACGSLPASSDRAKAIAVFTRKIDSALKDLIEKTGFTASPTPEAWGTEVRNGMPVLTGRIVGPNRSSPGHWLIDVYCPHCKTTHRHGWKDGVVEHRVAQCIVPNSPFKTAGYYIQPDALSRERLKRSVK